MESVNKLISGGRKQPCMDLNAIWTPCPRKSRTGHCRMFKKNTLKQLANNLWPSKINTHIYIYIYISLYYAHGIMHLYIYMVPPPSQTYLFFTYSSHGWVKRGLPYIQAYVEEKMAIVSKGGAAYVNIVV